MRRLEVLFSPAEFSALRARDLSQICCVVFDVLRATSSMVTALANGATAIVPVEEIEEAVQARAAAPGALLAGERQGRRIGAQLSGGIEFDLGNSPLEFTPEAVAGKTIVMTTTNGTRAIRACARAERVLVGSFLNLKRTSEFITQLQPKELLVVCSGTFEEAAYEDALAAGALCDLVWGSWSSARIADSALFARKLWLGERASILGAISASRNGRRLLSIPELAGDVAFCAQVDRFPLVAEWDSGVRVRMKCGDA